MTVPEAGTTAADLNLDGATWVGASVDEVDLESCSLRRLRASGSTWIDVTLTGWRLTGLDLSDATLTRVTLNDCDLTGARFAGARCTSVRLQGCALDGVTGITGLRGAELAWPDGVSALPALARELGLTILGDLPDAPTRSR